MFDFLVRNHFNNVVDDNMDIHHKLHHDNIIHNDDNNVINTNYDYNNNNNSNKDINNNNKNLSMLSLSIKGSDA